MLRDSGGRINTPLFIKFGLLFNMQHSGKWRDSWLPTHINLPLTPEENTASFGGKKPSSFSIHFGFLPFILKKQAPTLALRNRNPQAAEHAMALKKQQNQTRPERSVKTRTAVDPRSSRRGIKRPISMGWFSFCGDGPHSRSSPASSSRRAGVDRDRGWCAAPPACLNE